MWNFIVKRHTLIFRFFKICFCNCNKLQEAMGAVSLISSAKTALSIKEGEYGAHGKTGG